MSLFSDEGDIFPLGKDVPGDVPVISPGTPPLLTLSQRVGSRLRAVLVGTVPHDPSS
jgi:hypothetical protein